MSRIKNLRIIKHFEDNVNHKIHGIYAFDFDGVDGYWKDEMVIRHVEEVKNFSFLLGKPINECLRNVKKDVEDELIKEVEKAIKERDKIDNS